VQSLLEVWDVIVLVGTSSAGKTTIINALRAAEPEREEFGADRTSAERVYRHVAKHYKEYGVSKEDWEHIHKVLVAERGDWQIHNAIWGDFKFKPGVSEADQQRAQKTAAALRKVVDKFISEHPDETVKYLVRKSLELAKKGSDVIFDTINPEDVYQDPLSSQLSIKTVLVYCPFHVLSERVAERNRQAIADGKPQEVRAGFYPLRQFAEIFGPRKSTDSDIDVIDTVSKETVEQDFNLHFAVGIEQMRKEDPQQLAKMDVEATRIIERDRLLGALGFSPTDPPHKTVELTPRRKCDFRINTSDPSLGATPEECGRNAAARILGK